MTRRGNKSDNLHALRQKLRADPAARSIARKWRELTGAGRDKDASRRTLVACSGGADSCALVLALFANAQDPRAITVAHVVHDLRPRRPALADRDAAQALAQRLGLAWNEAEVTVRAQRGNLEALARDARYDQLARIATAHDCAFLATAHQGDDLIETFLMRVLRGAGPRGLACLPESRALGHALRLIRPMLGVTRADSERLCSLAGVRWREDATNKDVTRLRARLRADVLPVLREIAPDLHLRVGATVRVLEGWTRVIDANVDAAGARLSADAAPVQVVLDRSRVRAMDPALLAETLRACVQRAGGSMDRLSHDTLSRACALMQGPQQHAKIIRLPSLDVRVTSKEVRCAPRHAR